MDSKSSHEYIPMSENAQIPKESVFIQYEKSTITGFDAVLAIISSYKFFEIFMPFFKFLKKFGIGDRLYFIIASRRKNKIIEGTFRLLNKYMFHKQ